MLSFMKSMSSCVDLDRKELMIEKAKQNIQESLKKNIGNNLKGKLNLFNVSKTDNVETKGLEKKVNNDIELKGKETNVNNDIEIKESSMKSQLNNNENYKI